jgi:hypothetical protein
LISIRLMVRLRRTIKRKQTKTNEKDRYFLAAAGETSQCGLSTNADCVSRILSAATFLAGVTQAWQQIRSRVRALRWKMYGFILPALPWASPI